jgi:hypothetical protein
MVPVANDFAAIARRLKEIEVEVAKERAVAAAQRQELQRPNKPAVATPTESQNATTTRQFPLGGTRLQFGSSGDSNLGGEGCGSSRWERHARTLSHLRG